MVLWGYDVLALKDPVIVLYLFVPLQASGCDMLFVETVGGGQADVAIAQLVDMVLLVLPPSGGDELQGIKKGADLDSSVPMVHCHTLAKLGIHGFDVLFKSFINSKGVGGDMATSNSVHLWKWKSLPECLSVSSVLSPAPFSRRCPRHCGACGSSRHQQGRRCHAGSSPRLSGRVRKCTALPATKIPFLGNPGE